MRVRSVFAACTALCCLAWPAGARAAQREATLVATLGGASLKLEGLCAARVDVSVDPALHNRVAVSVAAQNHQEIDRLAFESGLAASVGPTLRTSCSPRRKAWCCCCPGRTRRSRRP
jgi:hypothetical protein